VGTNGSLTGYASGIERKIGLLKLEHANMEKLFVPKKGTAIDILYDDYLNNKELTAFTNLDLEDFLDL
jgi:hypothetical protein